MKTTDVIVIGAGQSGLAMSWLLTREGIDHVVLERRRVAERWLSERWDSLRLLTPNWFARLPGWSYCGPDRQGFMTMAEVAAYLSDYAASIDAPVVGDAAVTSVARAGGRYLVDSTAGAWRARAVVIATGACDRPAIPASARQLSPRIAQVASRDYRRPGALAPGGVLVIGASASGLQIARALADAGRDVTIAVGRHNRMPRRYRGHDIIWLLDRAGVLDESGATPGDIDRARHQPSLQLAGDDRPLDLAWLRAAGVRVTGRLAGIEGTSVQLAGDLGDTMRAADARLARVLARAEAAMLPHELGPTEPVRPIAFDAAARTLDLAAEGIGTVIWATGFRRAWPWLHVPVLDAAGEIAQRGGLTAAPGLYTLGMPFQRRRKSTFIDGAGGDARALLPSLLDHLQSRPRAAA